MKAYSILLVLVIAACSTSHKVKTYSSSDYSEAIPYAQKWMGGAPGSGSGVTLYIPAFLVGNADVQQVYFRGMQISVINYTSNDRTTLVARFTYKETNQAVMGLDPKDEYGNQAPDITKLPVELLSNEALLAVFKNNKTSFIKLMDIEEKEGFPYPSMPTK